VTDRQFWALRQAAARPAWLDETGLKVRYVECAANREHHGTAGLLGSLSVVLVSKHVGDFVWTWLGDLLVGERARAFLRENKLTGYRLKKAGVRFRKPEYGPPPKLWELKVIGWAGMASTASGVELAYSCSTCGMLEYRMKDSSRVVEPLRWDGSDFFMVWPLPRFIFLSDRAATLLRKAKLKGITVLPAQELELDLRASFHPGRLSHHMPLKRARELGQELGIV